MPRPEEIAKRILELRDKTGKTQEQFAESFGFSQSRVSGWELEQTTPSVEALVKLASLSKELNDPDGALFFLEASGLDLNVVKSAAGVLLGEEKAKTVIIPPFPEEGATPAAEGVPFITVPALFVTNKASTYWLLGQPPSPFDSEGRGFAPGDIIVFDALGAHAGARGFVGEEVLVRLPERRNQPGGLFIRRPGFVADGATPHMVLGPPDEFPKTWLPGRTDLIKLGDSHKKAAWQHPVGRDWYELSECEVLGKFIARFSVGTSEFWKRGARRQ